MAMGRVIRIFVAGLKGALEGLLALAVACAMVAVLPTVVTSFANRGTVDVAAFVPRSRGSASQNSTVTVKGSRADCATVRRALDDLVWSVSSSTLKILVTLDASLPPNVGGTYTYPENVIRVSRDVVRDPVRRGLSHVLAHELGHMLDFEYLNTKMRSEFMMARGRDPRQDWEGTGLPWDERPEEDFAEVFAALAAPSSVGMIQTDGGRIKNRARMLALIQGFEQIAGRPETPLQITMLPQLTRTIMSDFTTEPGVIPVILGCAVACVMVGTVGSMRRTAYATRSRTPQLRHRHLAT